MCSVTFWQETDGTLKRVSLKKINEGVAQIEVAWVKGTNKGGEAPRNWQQ